MDESRTEFISNTTSLLFVLVQWTLGFFLDAVPTYQGTGESAMVGSSNPELN